MGKCSNCKVSNSFANDGYISVSNGDAGGLIGVCEGEYCIAENSAIGRNVKIEAKNGNAAYGIGRCKEGKCYARGIKVGNNLGNDQSTGGGGGDDSGSHAESTSTTPGM